MFKEEIIIDYQNIVIYIEPYNTNLTINSQVTKKSKMVFNNDSISCNIDLLHYRGIWLYCNVDDFEKHLKQESIWYVYRHW